jgi:hypothetical protein
VYNRALAKAKTSMAADGACCQPGHVEASASAWLAPRPAAIAWIRKQAASMNAAPRVGQAQSMIQVRSGSRSMFSGLKSACSRSKSASRSTHAAQRCRACFTGRSGQLIAMHGADDMWQVRRARTIVRVPGTVDVLEGKHIPPSCPIVPKQPQGHCPDVRVDHRLASPAGPPQGDPRAGP